MVKPARRVGTVVDLPGFSSSYRTGRSSYVRTMLRLHRRWDFVLHRSSMRQSNLVMHQRERTMQTHRTIARVMIVVFVLGWSSTNVRGQVTGASSVQFDSADHTALVPVGEVGAGTPKVTGYQALLLLASSDAVSGPVIATGTVLPKASVILSPVATPPNPMFQATVGQLGITIPPCISLPCPQYSLILTAVGPGGTSSRGAASESSPFTASVPVPTSPPAAPLRVVVK